jgi:hypothetical protein
MNKVHKIPLTAILAFAMAFAFFACSGDNPTGGNNGDLSSSSGGDPGSSSSVGEPISFPITFEESPVEDDLFVRIRDVSITDADGFSDENLIGIAGEIEHYMLSQLFTTWELLNPMNCSFGEDYWNNIVFTHMSNSGKLEYNYCYYHGNWKRMCAEEAYYYEGSQQMRKLKWIKDTGEWIIMTCPIVNGFPPENEMDCDYQTGVLL